MKTQAWLMLAVLCLLSACEYSVSGCEGAVCVNAAGGESFPDACEDTGNCSSSCPDAQTVDASMLREITVARRLLRYCPALTTVALPNMALDQTLDNAAHQHADDMANHGFISETGSDGLSVIDRVRELASSDYYLDRQLAQLVASGLSSADEVVDFWLENPAHCALLLSGKYSHLGASCVFGTDDRARWSVVLGGAAL